MPSEILFSTPYITVEYRSDKQLIHHTIHQPISGQNQMFKDALNTGTDALAHYGVCKWLSDDRKNGPLSPEMVDWAFNEWNARAIQAGWKYWANVVPENIAAAGTLTPVINALHEYGLRMMVFTTVEDAVDWLDTVEG